MESDRQTYALFLAHWRNGVMDQNYMQALQALLAHGIKSDNRWLPYPDGINDIYDGKVMTLLFGADGLLVIRSMCPDLPIVELNTART